MWYIWKSSAIFLQLLRVYNYFTIKHFFKISHNGFFLVSCLYELKKCQWRNNPQIGHSSKLREKRYCIKIFLNIAENMSFSSLQIVSWQKKKNENKLKEAIMHGSVDLFPKVLTTFFPLAEQPEYVFWWILVNGKLVPLSSILKCSQDSDTWLEAVGCIIRAFQCLYILSLISGISWTEAKHTAAINLFQFTVTINTFQSS